MDKKYTARYTNPKATGEYLSKFINKLTCEDILNYREFSELLISKQFKNNSIEELQDLFRQLTGLTRYTLDPVDIEYTKTPKTFLKDLQIRGYVIGDCDDLSLFTIIILWCLGYQTALKIVQINSDDFEHIYPVVFINDKYVSFDLAVDKPFGWESTDIKKSMIFGVTYNG